MTIYRLVLHLYNVNNYFFFYRKVFLGCKKSNQNKLYAIKVMKKADMVQKNLGNQGEKREDFFCAGIMNIEFSNI